MTDSKTKDGAAVADEQPTAADTVNDQQLATQQQVEPPASKVPLKMGMAPSTPEEGWRLAQILARSELVPKGYRNKPADVLVAIQYGIEVGFAPMQALQSIAVINGRASVWGDGFLALLMSSPLYKDHDEYYEVGGERRDGLTLEELKRDDSTAVCAFWRRGKGTPVVRRFSVGQARKAGLLGKEGPWTNYPDRMMAMRARSWAGRDAFPDLLRGIRTAEEALDAPPDDDVIEMVQPRRASQAANVPAIPATLPDSGRGTATGGAAPSVPNGGDSGQPARQEARGLLVVNTAFIRPKTGEPYYEVETTAANGEKCVFVTRDERLYKEAASFEGSEHRITAAFHTDTGGNVARVLDEIGLFEGAAGLFG